MHELLVVQGELQRPFLSFAPLSLGEVCPSSSSMAAGRGVHPCLDAHGSSTFDTPIRLRVVFGHEEKKSRTLT